TVQENLALAAREGGAGLDPLALKALEKLKFDMRGKPTAAEAKAAIEAEAQAKAAGAGRKSARR
ncbi:MAG TPA: hypothetical protein PKE13_12575, partial [Hyphomicrobium zavarzinii]|nr:hypothetical protein [Hyphomicrobium zavarzinii]